MVEMADKILPHWADELKRRYLKGEASLFVLHGNVHDRVLYDNALVGVSDFLSSAVLEKKNIVIRYNVSTGCRFDRKAGKIEGLEELLLNRNPEKVLPVLERMLFTQDNVGLLFEYAEMVAPVGDATFFSAEDRQSVVSLQRWSLAPQLEQSDNIVLLLTEVPSDLNPKIMANPRVAAVKVPMPTLEERRAVIKFVNPQLDAAWVDRLADITAGLKTIQIKGILQPPPPAAEDAEARLRYIKSLVGDEARARKLAAVTQGMDREEIRELVGVKESPGAAATETDTKQDEVLRLIAKRKREIIERECFGLIEFVEPAHDFSVVGGIEEVKKELSAIARNIREGRKNRVPMGLLFTGPMGTGKTFVAEAFVKDSGLTAIKLKNFRSKWVGATESNLERILGVVQGIGNVIVIIDEGDRAFGGGGGGDGEGDGGTSSRVIARIKEFMSDTSNRGRVLFILMTNRPDKLDIDIKRAGRLDRKIPFLYPQSAEEVELVLAAQIRKHKLKTEVEFPRDRDVISKPIVGYSNADFEAIALLAHDYAAERRGPEAPVAVEDFQRAVNDYLPSRDVEMLEYMELLAVFEASNRRMLPAKYQRLTLDELQQRLAELKAKVGHRR
jgi:ATP-dependent 26S proteasome regulatory subunit